MSDLFTELVHLRRGRGVLTGTLIDRVGPLLRARAGIGDSDGDTEVAERLVAYLETLADTLPADLALAFRVGLALHPDAQFRFFEERMEWLGTEFDRDARTMRRRFDEAARLLEMKSREGVPSEGPLKYQSEYLYRPRALTESSDIRIGFITGDIRRVRCADIWVNSENTRMEMARFEEHSVSAVIRYHGARRDETGHVVDDRIARELTQKLGQSGQVAPGTAIATRSGDLRETNGVRFIVHVATVQGQPGTGYRQVRDIGHCVAKALETAERLASTDPTLRTILFPILGSGVGGAEPVGTLRTLVGETLDHLVAVQGGLRTVLFLAYSAKDLAACRVAFPADSPFLVAVNDVKAHQH
ncbi:macro domain-containing protein [Streptosporangium sp. NPDC002524]|uniref:macro domain-containing protein n=1 Tax=Streptosporangium sp. NPDC002524 TaxID=3154537 RepID=UPI003317E864